MMKEDVPVPGGTSKTTVVGVAIGNDEFAFVKHALSPEESTAEGRRDAKIEHIEFEKRALNHTLEFERANLKAAEQALKEGAAAFARNPDRSMAALEQEIARVNAAQSEAANAHAKVVDAEARARVIDFEKRLTASQSKTLLQGSILTAALEALRTLQNQLSSNQILRELDPPPPSQVWCAWPKPYLSPLTAWSAAPPSAQVESSNSQVTALAEAAFQANTAAVASVEAAATSAHAANTAVASVEAAATSAHTANTAVVAEAIGAMSSSPSEASTAGQALHHQAALGADHKAALDAIRVALAMCTVGEVIEEQPNIIQREVAEIRARVASELAQNSEQVAAMAAAESVVLQDLAAAAKKAVEMRQATFATDVVTDSDIREAADFGEATACAADEIRIWDEIDDEAKKGAAAADAAAAEARAYREAADKAAKEVAAYWEAAFGRGVLGGQTPAPAADSGIVGRVLVVRRRSRDGTDGTSGPAGL